MKKTEISPLQHAIRSHVAFMSRATFKHNNKIFIYFLFAAAE
jgi:hypothetical protein